MNKDDGVLMFLATHRNKVLDVQLVYQDGPLARVAVSILTSDIEDASLRESF